MPLLLVAALTSLAACGENPTTEHTLTPEAASMVVVSGNTQSAPAGTELPQPLVVKVVDSQGRPVPEQIINFRVTAGGGSAYAGTALTNAEGIAQERWTLGPTAGAAQSLEARAVNSTSGTKQVFATFAATALSPTTAVASVSVSPSSANLVVGGTQQLSATARNASGSTLTGKTFTWASSNTSIATVSSAGLVTARAAGSATITATSEGRSGTAAISVTSSAATDTIPPGTPGTPTITTSAVSADSFSVTASWSAATGAAKYQWRTGSNSGSFTRQGEVSTATVTFRAQLLSNANGYWFCVTAVDAAGNSSEDDACNSYTPPAGTPTQPAVATVAISPAAASLAVGATQQLTATAKDASGTTISGKTFTWASSNTAVATVNSSGLVTGRAGGTATITASVDGKNGTASITVTAAAPTVATVSVTPASASVAVGATQQLTATARDAAGTTISGKTFTWASSNTAVATVSSAGLVTGRAGGSATITATVDGKSGQSAITVTASAGSAANECASPQAGWIWCDDFEQDRLTRYFEYDNQGGAFARAASAGRDGSSGMRARFAQGATNAGSLKLAFGRTPDSYMRPVDAGTANYREIYFRFYLRNAPNWTGGGGDKLARATIFARSDWSQAMVAHVWSGGNSSNWNYLLIEPVSGTDTQGNLRASGYNDAANFRWLGSKTGTTPIFSSANVGQWYCIESRVRLNDAGQSNGVFQLWIDGREEAISSGLNWVGSYSAYGINSVLLENYWNNGSPQAQERYFDNLVVSTQRIGCSS
jgi:uncharacterized protein YjdB